MQIVLLVAGGSDGTNISKLCYYFQKKYLYNDFYFKKIYV